ncbi:MAG: hypothetical protein GY950_02700 [bacterium]|nr:hypothetical protein [bacterium]
MKKIIFKWADLFQKDFDRPEFFKKADIILRLLVVLLVAAVFLGHLDKVFTIPVEKPYYTGTWDEPFAVNAGINAIYRDGDPVFYNYGGTSVYPFALVFYKYCKANNIQPHYKTLDTKFKNPSWPITRKIYPVKPIYITKVFAYIAFLAGAFFFVALFSYYLLPVPFWLIPSITTASVFIKYSTQMLPETHLGLLAGVTAIAFVKAVIEKKNSRYFLLVVTCAAAASLTVAAKLNAVFIVFLPISLLWRLVSQKYLTLKRSALTAAAFIIPYILVNPAVIINFKGYKAWLSFMRKLSGTGSESLGGRQSGFLPFLKDLYMADALPVALVILLFLFTCIILVKRNPAAFAGVLAFFSLSLYTIGNMKHMLFDRHFVF